MTIGTNRWEHILHGPADSDQEAEEEKRGRDSLIDGSVAVG